MISGGFSDSTIVNPQYGDAGARKGVSQIVEWHPRWRTAIAFSRTEARNQHGRGNQFAVQRRRQRAGQSVALRSVDAYVGGPVCAVGAA